MEVFGFDEVVTFYGFHVRTSMRWGRVEGEFRNRCIFGSVPPNERLSMKMNRLIPMLPVKCMPASVAFYEKLGFTLERRQDDWGWAMLRFDDCRLMVDQSLNAHPDAARQGIIYLYPDNVVEFHRRSRANGIAVPELEITFYGMNEFRIVDPDGNQLWIGQSATP